MPSSGGMEVQGSRVTYTCWKTLLARQRKMEKLRQTLFFKSENYPHHNVPTTMTTSFLHGVKPPGL